MAGEGRDPRDARRSGQKAAVVTVALSRAETARGAETSGDGSAPGLGDTSRVSASLRVERPLPLAARVCYSASMRVSGFSFVRNAIDLYYPVVESIRSALPICDEFVIAAGRFDRRHDGAPARHRRPQAPHHRNGLGSSRSSCAAPATPCRPTSRSTPARGDWRFYLQADEVVHEDDLGPLRERLRAYRDDPARRRPALRVPALLRRLRSRTRPAHNWYRREVRVVRGGRGIRSWKSAQGFRRADGASCASCPPARASSTTAGCARRAA